MAEQLNTETAAKAQNAPPTDHNFAQQKEIIKSACERIARLDAERKSISEDIRTVKAEVKAFMKIADFNAIYRVFSLEEEARNEYLDALKIGFEALGIGAQSDMFDTPANGAAKE